MKLASGTAPVPKYLAAGVALGLGTDGAASNNDLDMFEAMRQAAFLHKLESHDPRAVPAPVALEMATIGGARVLGLEQRDRVARDRQARRPDRRRCQPRAPDAVVRPVSHLVYATQGDDVETTIVNGQVLMRERKVRTLDEASVLAEANRFAVRIQAGRGDEVAR